MLRCPLSLPLSKSYGARPTRAAICLRSIRPSSDKQARAVGEPRIGRDQFCQPLIEQADVFLQPCHATSIQTLQHGVLYMGRLVFDRDVLVAQLAPHGHDLSE